MSAKTWDPTDLKLMNSLRIKINYAHSIIKLTRILLSSLHAWNLDIELDSMFQKRLGLFKPKMQISFGHISRHHHITLMFPRKLTLPSINQQLKQTSSSSSLLSSPHIDALISFTSREHWSISRCLTTIHLLSMLSIGNSFMHLQHFIDLQLKSE